MNILKINAVPVFKSSDSKHYDVHMIISIDDRQLNTGYDIAIHSILGVITNEFSNDFDHFWTCDCGINGCAGIVDTQFTNKGNFLYCSFPDKVSTSSFKSYEEWKKQPFNFYKFSKEQIKDAMLKLADEIDSVIENNKDNIFNRFNNGYSEYGFEYEARNNLSDYIRFKIHKFY